MVHSDIMPKSRFLFPKIIFKLMPLERVLLLEPKEKSHWKSLSFPFLPSISPESESWKGWSLLCQPQLTLPAEPMGFPTVALLSHFLLSRAASIWNTT